MADPGVPELLGRAARLYRTAGCDDDACRCLERSGDFAAAAALHRQLGRFAAAAACFERAGQPLQAAPAHAAAGNPADAARCYREAGQALEAAWVIAHHLGQPARALATLLEAPPDAAGPAETRDLRRALVRARCLAATQPDQAARTLRQVAAAFAATATGAQPGLFAWALAVAETLDRPDLAARLFAALPAEAPGWADWARRRLGTADGIPLPGEAGPPAPAAEKAAR